jgi:hypothetical protein
VFLPDLIAEYREHAAFCEKMAEVAHSPEVRAGWLRLAEKWLSMIPPRANAQESSDKGRNDGDGSEDRGPAS